MTVLPMQATATTYFQSHRINDKNMATARNYEVRSAKYHLLLYIPKMQTLM